MADIDPIRQQLLGHLLGALDDDEQEWVDMRLDMDDDYRRQCAALRRKISPLLAARPDFDPPPGLAERTCRLVASFKPAPRRSESPRRAMSPDSALPSRATRISWLDVVAVVTVLAVFGILVPPAIHGGRFQARVASCQDGLRQVGLSLAQYGYHHGSDLSLLADNERLTTAGQFVADLMDTRLPPDDGRTVFPDAWLSVQGVLRWSPQLPDYRDPDSILADSESEYPLLTGTAPRLANLSGFNWSGVERNGTIDGSAEFPPAAVALLADAPSADTPDQNPFEYHDGQGRNRFFEDGHVDFLPSSTTRDIADSLSPRDDSPTTSIPVHFVGWH